MTQEMLSDLERWQSGPVEWLDKELAWLMSDKKSALCRMSEDDHLRASQDARRRFAEYQEQRQHRTGFGGYVV